MQWLERVLELESPRETALEQALELVKGKRCFRPS
jgi:hypothetical protein